MPKVHHVRAARKAIPSIGVEPGDSYYWWRTRAPGARSGTTRVSKTYTRPSQLTQSEFWSAAYAIQETAEDAEVSTAEDLESLRDDLAQQARDLGQEQSDKRDNMPEGLQDGPTGEMLQERADACETWADAIEAVEIPEREDDQSDEEYAEELQEALNEIASLAPEC